MASLKITEGQIFTEFQSYKVVEIKGSAIIVENENGDKIKLPENYVEQLLHSAEYFESEEKLSMTELAEKFTSSSRIAMSVSFYKKDKKKTKKAFNQEVEKAIDKVQNAKVSEVEGLLKDLITKPISEIIPGELRVMKGYHYGTMNELGRIAFIDRECTESHNIRLVDPRTIQSIIINKVKYTLKK